MYLLLAVILLFAAFWAIIILLAGVQWCIKRIRGKSKYPRVDAALKQLTQHQRNVLSVVPKHIMEDELNQIYDSVPPKLPKCLPENEHWINWGLTLEQPKQILRWDTPKRSLLAFLRSSGIMNNGREDGPMNVILVGGVKATIWFHYSNIEKETVHGLGMSFGVPYEEGHSFGRNDERLISLFGPPTTTDAKQLSIWEFPYVRIKHDVHGIPHSYDNAEGISIFRKGKSTLKREGTCVGIE